MSYLPCKNPSCKSFGRPHPNCRCYAELAEGGDVSFCGEDRNHREDCEYFAAGGGVSDDHVPLHDLPAELIPSAPPISASPGNRDVPASDLPDMTPSGPVPLEDVPGHLKDRSKYETAGQQILAMGEGLGRAALPLGSFTGAEKALSAAGIPGLSSEDIHAREETLGPWEQAGLMAAGIGASQFIPVVGQLNAVSKIGKFASEANVVQNAFKALGMSAQAGSKILGSAIQSGLIQSGNEAHNWLLKDAKEDSWDAVGAALATGSAAILGGGLTAAGKLATVGAEKLANKKFVGKALGYLSGIADSGKDAKIGPFGEKILGTADKGIKNAYQLGRKTFESKALTHGSSLLHAGSHLLAGDPAGALATFLKDELYLLGVKAVSKRALDPVLTKVITSGTDPLKWATQIDNAVSHGANVIKGKDLITRGVDAVMKGTATPAIDAARNYEQRLKERRELDENIRTNTFGRSLEQSAQQEAHGYAKGGEVTHHGKLENSPLNYADTYPNQAMLMGTAQSRIHGYLGNMLPTKEAGKLPFDHPPDNSHQVRSYNNALDIANRPTSILDHIRRGTLEVEHIKHLEAMYPETADLLKKEFTSAITKAQMEGKKPSYQVRIGLSLLMGASLSSDLTQPYIAASQNVFPQAKADQQAQGAAPQTKNKHGTSTLGKASKQYLTSSQDLVSTQQQR